MNPKLLILTICLAAGSSFAQLSCGLKQAPFVSEEELHYRVDCQNLQLTEFTIDDLSGFRI